MCDVRLSAPIPVGAIIRNVRVVEGYAKWGGDLMIRGAAVVMDFFRGRGPVCSSFHCCT